jgi:Bacterial SH3 domain
MTSRWSGLHAVVLTTALFLSGCAANKPETQPSSAASRRAARQSAALRKTLERRISRLEMIVLEKDAQVEELETRLQEARQEVVRAMAKLQTLASRAEAASGMAEAELALQSLNEAGQESAPEADQASMLLRESSNEFDKENYGGALYLANQAKALAAIGRGRATGGEARRGGPQSETPFALPIPLQALTVGNVRESPGLKAAVAFGVEPGTQLTGYSYVDEWIRVSDQEGRAGWIFRSLVARR